MTNTDFKALGGWMLSHGLSEKSIDDYSKKEIGDLVEFIIDTFAKSRPCPIMWDHSHRLIIPANADHGQLRAAIGMIEAMIKFDSPSGTITSASEPHVWEQYQ